MLHCRPNNIGGKLIRGQKTLEAKKTKKKLGVTKMPAGLEGSSNALSIELELRRDLFFLLLLRFSSGLLLMNKTRFYYHSS